MSVPSQSGEHAEQIYAVVQRGRQAQSPLPNAEISRSWTRCIEEYHLSPDGTPTPLVVEAAELRERQEHLSNLLALAKAEMTNLYQQVAGSGYAIMLVDTDGVVLHYVGDPSFSDTATHAGLRPGGIWSEQAQGTNGMGTCLAEGKPLTVHRHEHFLARNTALTCSAAPVHNPNGKLMAVLDASSGSTMGQQHTVALVNMSARMIENRLFLCAFRNHFVLRFHSRPEFISTLGEGTIAFDTNGRVVAANQSALFQLGHNDRDSIVGHLIEHLFDIKVEALLARTLSHPLQTVPIRDAREGRPAAAALPGEHGAARRTGADGRR